MECDACNYKKKVYFDLGLEDYSIPNDGDQKFIKVCETAIGKDIYACPICGTLKLGK